MRVGWLSKHTKTGGSPNETHQLQKPRNRCGAMLWDSGKSCVQFILHVDLRFQCFMFCVGTVTVMALKNSVALFKVRQSCGKFVARGSILVRKMEMKGKRLETQSVHPRLTVNAFDPHHKNDHLLACCSICQIDHQSA